MRKVQRWRYYCDHCKKVTGSRPSMEKHEKGCTNRPDRVCGLCYVSPEHVQKPLEELKAAWAVSFAALIEAAGNCPACILATLRQGKGPAMDEGCWESNDPRYEGYAEWNFADELKAFWKEHNANERDSNGGY